MSVLSECPFQNPEIANHPDADQKITFDPPERGFDLSDAARTKYLTRYLASFSISTELALSRTEELTRNPVDS